MYIIKTSTKLNNDSFFLPQMLIMNCIYFTWLRLSDIKNVILIDIERLTRLISKFDHSSSQWFTFLLFVDRKAKQITLKEIFPYNNIKKSINENIITWNKTASIHIEYSIFSAKSDSFKFIIIKSKFHAYCHNVLSIFLQWIKSVSNNLFDIIYVWLFDFFVDVLCILTNDFKNFDNVVHKLKT